MKYITIVGYWLFIFDTFVPIQKDLPSAWFVLNEYSIIRLWVSNCNKADAILMVLLWNPIWKETAQPNNPDLRLSLQKITIYHIQIKLCKIFHDPTFHPHTRSTIFCDKFYVRAAIFWRSILCDTKHHQISRF